MRAGRFHPVSIFLALGLGTSCCSHNLRVVVDGTAAVAPAYRCPRGQAACQVLSPAEGFQELGALTQIHLERECGAAGLRSLLVVHSGDGDHEAIALCGQAPRLRSVGAASAASLEVMDRLVVLVDGEPRLYPIPEACRYPGRGVARIQIEDPAGAGAHARMRCHAGVVDVEQ